MTPVEKLQLKNAALRVLHAPGGPLAGGVPTNAAARQTADFPDRTGTASPLELSLVFDGALSKEAAKSSGGGYRCCLKERGRDFPECALQCGVLAF